MDVRTTMLLEKVIELDTDRYTFEVKFNLMLTDKGVPRS